MKHQPANVLFRLLTVGVDSTELQEEIRVTVVSRMKNHDQISSVVPGRTQKKERLLRNPDEHELELPMLSELITAQSSDMFCKQSF